MITNSTLRILFVLFAFLVQVLLVANFAASNLRLALEQRYGWIIYGLGIPAVMLGILLLVARESWAIVAAPFIYAVWAGARSRGAARLAGRS